MNRSQTANFTDSVTYIIHRNHNLTFGVGYRRMQQNTLSFANSRGSFTFGGLLTSGIDATGKAIANTGFDFADFLLGYPQTSSLRIGNSNNYFRGWSANGFVQDDWRVNRGLTINLGLRYEYFSPYTELFGHLANLDLTGDLTAAAVVTPGARGLYTGAYPDSLVNGDPNNFSPRIGFAWRPSQKHSRMIRGGYSIFYSGSSYPQMASRMAAQPPFARTGSLATSLADPLTLQNGFPTQPSDTITNTYAVDQNYKLAYAQTWTVALQQTLPHNLLAELEYVGTKGTGLDVVMNPNQTPPGTVAASAADLERQRLHLRDGPRQFDLPRRAGAHHAAVLARHVGGGALHLLEIHRRRFQLYRRRRGHARAESAGPAVPSAGSRRATSGIASP